jgi:DNA (cytosine-5)-methyltransferase 1
MIGATLFSGIGAPEAAMHRWHWPWHAEIEKFPSAVMARRHPRSLNLGDVTANDFCERARAIATPDVLIFGSPCQSFSVAGKRLGMDDPRGNLALVALGIVGRLKPRWFILENVPGLFSSFSGSEHAEGLVREGPVGGKRDGEESRDFATFLTRVHELGYSLAWTVLDAQHFGVAQRRERVFAVGYLGDWRGPAAVLFEPESLCGHSPPRRETGKTPAGTLTSSLGRRGGQPNDDNPADYLIAGAIPTRADHGGTVGQDALMMAVVANTLNSHTGIMAPDYSIFIAHALRAEGFDASEDGTGRGTPIIPIQEVGKGSTSRGQGPNGCGIGSSGDPMFTLQAGAQHAIAFDTTQITSKTNRCQPREGEPCHPLAAAAHPPAIAFSCKDHGADAMADLSPTLRAGTHDKSHANAGVPPAIAFDARQSDVLQYGEKIGPLDTDQQTYGVPRNSAVRRLTPRECERLQGYSDNYTLIEYRGKPVADGPRYKALGNSMAVPVMRWILSRIEQFEAIEI